MMFANPTQLARIVVGLLCLSVVFVSGQTVNFQKIDLTTVNPNAVCNDNSPAVYYFRPGYGSGSSVFTIYLEGGGLCYDKDSCEYRWNTTEHFMTSTQLPPILNDTTKSPDVNHGGINSGSKEANPHFYNANQAYIWYCSSDVWAGNNQTFNGWSFRGRIIIEAVLQHLLYVQTPSLTKAKFILLTGFSAGGFGVLNNVDFVGEIISQTVPYAVYKGFVDSGWVLDFPSYDPTDMPARTMMDLAYKNFNLQFDYDCVETFYPSQQQWRCTFADDALPFISSSLFVAGYQYDMPFLPGVGAPFTNSTLEFAYVCRNNFLMQSNVVPFFFSPDCYCHGVQSYDTRWNVITVNNVTASESVWQFLTGNFDTFVNIDSCATMDCNPTCSCIWT
eukprot:TRINITY_DN5686_c0_g1_i1.p1 TRINITY_DN5686_c0_g1~~TRINITY_DN5686_c0_g1_i1.p1  ORF type:complete len:389 (-),score=55.64 TRINITY_DN5686_c0_g1_i1:105-1271(-)